MAEDSPSVLAAEVERLRTALRDSEDRLEALLRTAIDGIVIIDEHGCITTFSAGAERIFGFAAAEVLGTNVSMLMPEPDRSRHDGYIRNYLATGNAKIIGIGREVVGRRKDGATFPMELAVGEMTHASGRYFVGVVRDISNRKAIEAQLIQASKMEAIGRLTGGIAHDFNNQLAVLTMDLELLAATPNASPEMAELIEEAREVVSSATDLTRRLLAISRRQPLVPSVLDVGELIAQMTGLLRRSLGGGIRIDTMLPSDLWLTHADKAQLENVILNLAVNARDAMPDGGRLSIEASNVFVSERRGRLGGSVPPGAYVLLAVSDTGTGMSPEVVEHAFEPFFTTKEAGTGLGLSMVYGFVGQSGGHVRILSKPGAGTTVRLYLPRHTVADVVAAQDADRHPVPRGGHETIMLVEDHALLRERTAGELRALGYRVDVCADAADALARIDGGARVDLMFTDVVMPGDHDGRELVRLAREKRPNLRFLFMSGYAGPPAPVEDLLVSGGRMLQKPFSRDRLAIAIRAALDDADDS